MKIWKEQLTSKKYRWHANFVCRGKRYRPEADSKDELDDIIEAIKKRGRQEKYGLPIECEAVTLKQLVERRVKDFNEEKKSHRRARMILEDFAQRFPDYSVADLTTVDLSNFINARKGEFQKKQEEAESVRPLSPETINKELGYISAMLKRAPQMFKALADYRPPKIPWEKVSRRKRRRPLLPQEDAQLLGALRAPRQKGEQPRTEFTRHEVADLFEINLNTGMRGGETVKLTWPQIDFDGKQIYLGETKNGEDRFVPMNSRVVEILKERYRARTSRFVFPNPDGTRPRYDYTRTFSRVARALGLPYGQQNPYGFTMHSTRHTATTRMLRAGHDVASVQEIVGHSDRTMTLIYSHATADTRKRAVESLARGPLNKKRTKKKRQSDKAFNHAG